MSLDYKQLAKVGAISALAYLLVSQVRDLLAIIKDSAEIEEKEVKNLAEVQHLLINKENSRLNILKLKPYYFQPLNAKKSIRSAEKMKFQPSDVDMVRAFKRKLSYQIRNITNLNRIPFQWFAFVEHSNGPRYHKIYGFGEIQGDFLSIKKKYEPIKKLSFWKRFRNWISKKIWSVLPEINTVGTTNPQKPLFMGPVIGYLHYQIDLMRDTSIIAVCNIQDGKIVPTVTALSKSDILNYFKSKIALSYLKVAGYLIVTIVMGRWLWSDIKAMINGWKVRRQKFSTNYFNPQVTDDRVCIICYTSCRNMVFFDCRHMIMCRECSEHYKSDVCPYCKLQIDEIKMVNGVHVPK